MRKDPRKRRDPQSRPPYDDGLMHCKQEDSRHNVQGPELMLTRAGKSAPPGDRRLILPALALVSIVSLLAISRTV
jgi:hypothetical protein